MRITFVITALGMGGAETQVCTLAAGFARRGATAHIISMMPLIADHPQLKSDSVQVSTLEMTRGRWGPSDYFRYVKTARASRPDIIHAHLFHANVLARVGRPFVRAPLICTVHNTTEQPEHAKDVPRIATRLRELAYPFTDRLCELTTQVSVQGAKRYIAIGAVPERKLLVVPNGIDCDRFRPDPERRRLTRDQLALGEAFTWIWIGRLEEEKDPCTVLQAFQTVAASAGPTVLLMLGSGLLANEVRQRAASLGIAEKVRFLGIRSDVPDLLDGADGYVLSSLREGFPMVVLEAAASGLPVVVTSVGAEAVLQEKSGWVVGPRDPNALAGRMLALMALSPPQRAAMGAQGREFVSSKFSLGTVLDTWEGLYTSLIEKRGVGIHRVRPSA